MKVSDLKQTPYNPRKITKHRESMLQASMREFGDLGGIVFNVRTGNLVGGNRRVGQLNPDWPVVKKKVEKDKTGTVALGYVETPYGRLSFREVDWPEKREKAARLTVRA